MDDAITVVPVPPPGPEPDPGAGDGWWPRYRAAVAPRLSPIGLEVLEADARYIADRATPMRDGEVDAAAWPESRVRTGMVVGSVQSGKTASMLAVAALCLDQGVDILVLLAGTRVGLWLQTYERLLTQLDGSTLETAWQRSGARLLLPQPEDVLNAVRAEPSRYLNKVKAKSALQRGLPIIFVVPKEDDHLLHLSRFLKEVASDATLSARARPLTMLVLDDEADDASVLDSALSSKVTPRFITALWSGDPDVRETRHPHLLASYVAYTATPQANYLQATHNPLAPRDLHAALRTPGMSGALHPRDLSYEEPRGVRGYYCGGDVFYGGLSEGPGRLCLTTEFPVARLGETESALRARQQRTRWDMIGDAVRAYLVAGALRLLQSKRSLKGLATPFDDLASLRAVLPVPHTMLFHPSARKDQHFRGAEDIVRWSRSLPGAESAAVVPEDEFGNPILELSVPGLTARLDAEEPAWQAWIEHYGRSRDALTLLPLAPYAPLASSLWGEVRQCLVDEVFGGVAIRVLNSDPAADDRPQFEPRSLPGGAFQAPADVFTIFVAGNVLSRGLTLEGLCTSLFLRSATEPAADTQMQMQRWFGYRGEHLPFCRVLMFSDQADLFERYHVNDAALKWQVLKSMEDPDADPDRSMLVLQGAQFVATSKVDSRRVPLNPGPRPSVRLVERTTPQLVTSNGQLLKDLLADGDWVDLVGPSPTRRGLIRQIPVSLLELADWLDRFRYTRHDPEPDNELSRRWRHLGDALQLETALFRPPGVNPAPYAVEPQSCPYSIAAYLRLWHALRMGHLAPGFYPTDRPKTPWSFDDNTLEPRFYVALRYGEAAPRDPELAARGIRAVTRQVDERDRLATLWGTRGYGDSYYGDEFVDYYHHNTKPVPSLQGGASWRPRGHPGLALFHLITDDHGGPDMLTLGLSVPHGGPDHIAALGLAR